MPTADTDATSERLSSFAEEVGGITLSHWDSWESIDTTEIYVVRKQGGNSSFSPDFTFKGAFCGLREMVRVSYMDKCYNP